jgi:hypothetical protein
MDKLSCLLKYASGEFLLNRMHNGGTTIFARSLLVATLLFVGAVCVLYTQAKASESLLYVSAQHLDWFGVTFAAVYAALYARFSSQWTYLADLYNRIKEAQSTESAGDEDRYSPAAGRHMAEWKAAFLEDAHLLHLATKPPFADVVRAWGNERDVRDAFIANTSSGAFKWAALRHLVVADCLQDGCVTCTDMRGATQPPA